MADKGIQDTDEALSSSLDDLFGDPAEFLDDEDCPGAYDDDDDANPDDNANANANTENAVIPPPDDNDDLAYGLRWVNEGGNIFSPKPEWTVEPALAAVAATMERALGGPVRVRPLHDGAFNKLYAVRHGAEDFVLRVSLPVAGAGGRKTAAEVGALRWVREHTRLAVPRVRAYSRGGGGEAGPLPFEWVLAGRVPGAALGACWDAVTLDAKRRVVAQLAEFAAAAFAQPFAGVGSLYYDDDGDGEAAAPRGERAALRRYAAPFRTAGQWTRRRLRLVAADLRQRWLEAPNAAQRDTARRMLALVERLRGLEDEFFPTPHLLASPCGGGGSDLEPSTDEDVAGKAGEKRRAPKPREPTVLWHDDLSLDNIFVDDVGVLRGVIGWECVSCLPLYEACRLPAFLQQARGRPVAPLRVLPYASPEGDTGNDRRQRRYDEALRQHHIYLLRRLFLHEMAERCPAWVEVYRRCGYLRDYEAAVQNCDNEFAYRQVERWVDAVEGGEDVEWVEGTFHEQFLQ
ncbi:hypothetical protein GGS23DRAFT_611533 [Durotheca rogersii]|uniref:uncharacterized protein n=1 Tax=Durotheca rogersii TaxID=419775 RepID=UPI00221F2A61|nr:uncharacterized protein GGS23DRAFT_611533 [Durotheca rogersii]KAI5861535.1 hypothetical protein GGS23DRAFT_611533 [Durotheca rogersii]